ncbi:hypothetical protein [Ectothiorhodospira variabilis]|uniref:TubC N-terminal docking domain-related protein n=1 Tax=Ectothiorhodospira variabilis TaxID=505694 RepID=UPI001EFBC189|nr:hypothetical protein [Ectothiorhodospira variabilis]MCG5494413.1 hypothetical protein [Ectothiorhodospira variabilis]MCG5503216.1 hypothetical protein [Ectothiorhodospira variabilis]MCG5506025.1 hypothetical protein [Ectothiorhodospira variabilis]
MSAATDLLTALTHRGITLAANDDRLTVEPATLLTEDDRAAIREHKHALLRMVRAQDIGRQRLEAACARHGADLESALMWYGNDDFQDMADNPSLADLAVADAIQNGIFLVSAAKKVARGYRQ